MITDSTLNSEIIFRYEGPCTNRVIQDSVDKINLIFPEEKFNGLGKRLSAAAIEMIQNIGFYSDEKTVIEGELIGIGSFSIIKNADLYLMGTKNRTTDEKFSKFDNWVKKLNSLSKDELKQLRKDFLKNSAAPGSRGANIGLLDIVRKYGSPVLTSTSYNNGLIYLTITVQFNEE